MIHKAWTAYRRYFLDHIPAHFIGFVMGCAYEAVLFVTLMRGG